MSGNHDGSNPGSGDSDADATVTSLSSERAKRSENSADWTPRDCIDDFVGKLIAGELNPDALFIAYRDSDSREYGFMSASPTQEHALALMEIGKVMLVQSVLFDDD